MMRSSLLGILSTPAIQSINNDGKGKMVVSVGNLYRVVGWWLYQQGALLGYALGTERGLLEKILILSTTQSINQIGRFQVQVQKDLRQVSRRQKHFTCLYSDLEMEKHGLGGLSPDDPRLNENVDLESYSSVLKNAFFKGVTLGYYFPIQMEQYWENTYPRFHDHSQNSTNIGINIGYVMDTILGWDELEGYEVLSPDDVTVIKNLKNKYRSNVSD